MVFLSGHRPVGEIPHPPGGGWVGGSEAKTKYVDLKSASKFPTHLINSISFRRKTVLICGRGWVGWGLPGP